MTARKVLYTLLAATLDLFPVKHQLLLGLVVTVELVTFVENLRQTAMASRFGRSLARIAWWRMAGLLAGMGAPFRSRNGASSRTGLAFGLLFS